jgi:tetratricopeptide (TPR) repeat protein
LIPKFAAKLNLVAAEHHLYLPAIGFFFIIARVIAAIMNRLISLKLKIIFVATIITAIISLSIITIHRNKIWGDTFLLWKDAVRISPKSLGAITNLGLEYLNRGQTDEAIECFNRALRIKPPFIKDIEVYLRGNLSNAYKAKGLYDEAKKEIEKALEITPYEAPLHNNLGLLHREKGLDEEAMREFKKAISLDNNLTEAHLNLGSIYWHKGDFDLAILEFKNAIKANPDYLDAYYVLAKAYEDKGRLNEAKVIYEKILTLNPNNFEDYYTLGVIYGKLGDSRAIEAFNKAIKINPEFAPAYYNLAVSFAYLSPPKIELAWRHLDLAEKFGYKPDPKFLSYLESLMSKDVKH